MKKLLVYFIFTITLFAECHYNINLELYPSQHRLSAQVDIKNSDDNIILNLDNFNLSNKDLLNQKLQAGTKAISFSYEKVLKDQVEEEFIFLGNDWLPLSGSLCTYELNLTLPKGFIAMSESEAITAKHQKNKTTYRFTMQKPIDHINVIASKNFVLNTETFGDLEISTYFFKEHAHLSDAYIKKVKHYIDMYEKILGKFPYTTFRVVENSFQTGYSMPTFTLIGDKIIDKPFLLDVSLGHEIVHQWFGNAVFNDFNKGNWVEGITTYLADHYYKELKGEGWEYRKKILRDYEAYVNENNLFALSDFKQRTNRATMAIGYGKGAFAFHTLRVQLGDELFFNGLKAFYKEYQFKYATYADIAAFYSSYADINCSDLIHNMFEHKDIIDFKPSNMNLGYENGTYKLNVSIPHDKDKYHGYKAPLIVKTIEGEKNFSIDINGDTNFSLSLEDRPLELIFDRDYDLFRKLSPQENAPSLAKLIADEHLLIVTDSSDAFEKIKRVFIKASHVTKEDLTFVQMQNSNILFLDDAKDLAQKAIANLQNIDKGFLIQVEKNPWNKNKAVAYVEASDASEAKKAARKITHYTKYSKLYFQDGRIKEKSILPTQRGKIYPITKEKQAVKVSENRSFKEIIDEISNKRVIFVGEAHTTYVHHINQLEVIKALHKQGKKVAIGMEMFQRKFQSVLDDYIAGKIDEKTFLKDSEYFTRWKFNYNLYKPIIDFAKENAIPIVALNLEKEIIKKVTKHGFYALSAQEKKLLPKNLDFSNEAYKNYLHAFFNSNNHAKAIHDKNVTLPNKEFLYQSQILWEETMAETASNYIQNHDNDVFVVLSGIGHIVNFHGIPDRVHRRVNLPYSVITQDMPAVENSADFVLFTNQMQVKVPMMIGVMLDTNKNLKVIKVIKDSIAQKLGIQENDIILSVDGHDVKKLEDLKFLLFFKDSDKNITIKIERDEKIVTLKSNLEVS